MSANFCTRPWCTYSSWTDDDDDLVGSIDGMDGALHFIDPSPELSVDNVLFLCSCGIYMKISSRTWNKFSHAPTFSVLLFVKHFYKTFELCDNSADVRHRHHCSCGVVSREWPQLHFYKLWTTGRGGGQELIGRECSITRRMHWIPQTIIVNLFSEP